MRFDFASATRILFAPGAISELPAIAGEFGSRALLVTGRNTERAAPVSKALTNSGIDVEIFAIDGEPTVDNVRDGARVACGRQRDFLVGMGGGSPMDAAKAIAILATNSGDPLDYLEVVGRGQIFEHAPLPFLAVPTTAGTGAEVTRNAVLGSPADGVKASLRSPSMLAKVAVVDSDLTLDMPPDITAITGLDALTQLIEPFVSCRGNSFVDLFCVAGMKHVKESLGAAFIDGQNRTARESMSFASLLSGLSLANAGLGVVHGFAAPLGGMLNAPHGAVCAAVLPWAVLVNVQALRRRESSNRALQKYTEAARLLTGNPHAEPEDLHPWLKDLTARLEINSLRHYGLRQEQIPLLVDKAAKASSMKANPITLTSDELTAVAEQAF